MYVRKTKKNFLFDLYVSTSYNTSKLDERIMKGGGFMLIAKPNVIKKKRLELHLSQRQLSLKAGLPDNAICRIENKNFNSIYPIRAKAIADALGCEIKDLFNEI